MKKLNTSPISGMQELLPAQQAIFDQLKSRLSEVYHRHAYQHIETPVIDRTAVLLAKAGGDTEKQIYKVIKTAESADSADQALRFDHTVPLARYVVEHENDLAFPFKVTQIGRNFRGEHAQKGRFREFYQCDVDVIGRGNLPLAYDADVIAVLLDALRSILSVVAPSGSSLRVPLDAVSSNPAKPRQANAPELPNTNTLEQSRTSTTEPLMANVPDPLRPLARISNRKIWTGLFEALNLQNRASEILRIVDHAEKMPAGAAEAAIAELGLSEDNVVKITTLMHIRGNASAIEPCFSELGLESNTFSEGVAELLTVLRLLEAEGLGDYITADLLIVRGLDYYTGTVFEFILPEHREIGSVCGGGRYDNLAGYFTDQLLPGVGGSIGLTRLFYILSEQGLITANASVPVDIMLMPLSPAEYEYCFILARQLRSEGKSVDIDFSEKRLGDRFNRAARIARQAIVIGENEVQTGEYRVKDLSQS